MSEETNPLFAIAKGKHQDNINEGGYDFLNDGEDNQLTFTLGFCNGVSHATAIFQAQIAELQNKVAELQKL